MKTFVVRCGSPANQSEMNAIETLSRGLEMVGGHNEWILLTNLAFSLTHQFQADEIDIVAIGPPGIRLIDVKHWSVGWVEEHKELVEQEADKLTSKARRIGTMLRAVVRNLPKVDGVFLLTRQPSNVRKLVDLGPVRGVPFYTLNQWQSAINRAGSPVLSPVQVRLLSETLCPRSVVRISGSLRRLAGYIDLELQTPREERFHRIYRGRHPSRRDRVLLHLYDLSAHEGANAKALAGREFEALQKLQLYSWAPRILDSFQDAPGYWGEMFFFTVVDPAAPTIEARAADVTWTTLNRLYFAREAVRALEQLHQAGSSEGPFVHRQLTPQTILVRHDNAPIFTGFERTRLPAEMSVACRGPCLQFPETVAPEVHANGLTAAGPPSDVFSLCACLSGLFVGQTDELATRASEILRGGLAEAPAQRATLEELGRRLSELLGDSLPTTPAPPARYWTEDQLLEFHDRQYRIVCRLGSGGVGIAFKVVEIDGATKEELGTYVAKVAHDGDTGQRILKAYSLARSHLGRHEALSPIYEVAHEWHENEFLALLGWIEGTPLSEFIGVFPLLAEDQDELSPEALAIRWLRLACEALAVLHRNGLTHGDVSPHNMIVSGSLLVLTDYDFVTRIGEPPLSPGTISYCSPQRQQKQPASAADDLYALAASFFHVIFEKEPFRYGDELAKDRGLHWGGVDLAAFGTLAPLLDRATHPDPSQRFASAAEMLAALEPSHEPAQPTASDGGPRRDPDPLAVGVAVPRADTPRLGDAQPTATHLTEQRIDWLRWLLQSYPGSPWGNQETRGLDSCFAADTYVPTALEQTLLEDIRACRIRLVVLCGNAGDGKTALLQHIAKQLGLGRHHSSDRILEGRVPNGPFVRMNLDGSAAWNGRSADEILDEFLAPFQDGPPADDIVHLLAVNDGRLLEWIGGVEKRLGRQTPLTAELSCLLQQQSAVRESHIRFVSLNRRCLVGGIAADRSRMDTAFLDRLLDSLYGGQRAAQIWSPCHRCSAKDRCGVFQATEVFAPAAVSSTVPHNVRRHARQRLLESLQAVHLRAQTHITVRELRAALVYILFGIHFCDDYHRGVSDALPYWDRAFAAEAPGRQGDVLRELALLDPALESHPQVDRYLLRPRMPDSTRTASHYEGLPLASARRRAFFEWTLEDVEQVAGDPNALTLARGRHLKLFCELPLEQDPEKLADITRRLCAGIARLEDLPPLALDRPGVVPLRIAQRTPTETAFWVEKPLERFRLDADLSPAAEGIEQLHRQISLIYRFRDGNEECLRMGAELFHLLLELADGYQLGDVSTDDTFANLSIFVQRLLREDERHVMAWNPMQDEQIYQVAVRVRHGPKGPQQFIEITAMTGGAES